MSKRLAIVLLSLILCLAFAQSAFAEGKEYPNEYRVFEVKGEDEGYYTLEEAYWFNPTIYSVEALEFMQAYLEPDDPVSFFLEAAQFTDEEIDEYVVIFQSFIEPEYVGAFPYEYRCDIEALSEVLGYELFDPTGRYELSYYYEDPHFFIELFPRGIGRANAYDTFRRCALQLAFYTKIHGETPTFQILNDFIQSEFARLEEEFNAAMEAEALAEAEKGMEQPEDPTAVPTDTGSQNN